MEITIYFQLSGHENTESKTWNTAKDVLRDEVRV